VKSLEASLHLYPAKKQAPDLSGIDLSKYITLPDPPVVTPVVTP